MLSMKIGTLFSGRSLWEVNWKPEEPIKIRRLLFCQRIMERGKHRFKVLFYCSGKGY